MRAVIQTVSRAQVSVEGKKVASIDKGLLVFIGIKRNDSSKDRDFMIKKILQLRIFPDKQNRINSSVTDIDGKVLLVSQFTLYGNCRNGNRPSFIEAMPPEEARAFYDDFVATCKSRYHKTESGIFQAFMQVELINNGPGTFILSSEK